MRPYIYPYDEDGKRWGRVEVLDGPDEHGNVSIRHLREPHGFHWVQADCISPLPIPPAQPEWATGEACWQTDAAAVREHDLEWWDVDIERFCPASDLSRTYRMSCPFIAREPAPTVTLTVGDNLTHDELFDASLAAKEAT